MAKRLGAIFSSKMMLLLICVPLGLLAERMGLNSAMIFCFNFLALVPLAGAALAIQLLTGMRTKT